MNTNITNRLDKYENIYSSIQSNEDILNKEVVEDIKQFSTNIRSKIEDAIQTDRLLRLGIVGEVKAGKSTFLNALIFDGKQILPQAATPMTAALTKIVYSEQLKAEVEFYTESDWQTIVAYSNEFEEQYRRLKNEFIEIKKEELKNKLNLTNVANHVKSKFNDKDKQEPEVKINKLELQSYIRGKVSDQAKGCYELVKMLENSDIDFDSCISRGTDIIDNINSVDDLMGRLENYVGAKGQYTPIVKSTKIYLNFENLKGLEIIDTPGTNDPIVSRSMATRKYLGNCDVVFLLSYAGQFMKSQDVQFLSQVLPSEGIQNGIIIGSKFDSALLDDNNSGNDFIQSLRITTSKLNKHAQDIIDTEIQKDPSNKILKSIKDSLPPIYVSPMSYIISKKDNNSLNENEAHVIKRLKQRFSEFNFTSDILRQFSSIDKIHNDKLEAVRKNKELILSQKLDNTLIGQGKKVRSLLLELDKDVNIKLDNLCNSDKKQLDENLRELRKQTTKIETRIIQIFDNELVDIEKHVKTLNLDIKSKYREYDILDVNTKTDTKTNTSRGGFLWMKKTTTHKTVTTYEAKIKEVVDNVRSYAIDIEKSALDGFDKIIDTNKIKDKLKNAVIEELDLNDKGIDEEQILHSIESVLRKLKIQDLKLDINKYEKLISESFSGSVVKNDEIHKLESKQRDTLVKISEDVGKELNSIYSKINNEFNEYSSAFSGDLVETLEGNIDQIKIQLDSKEEYIERYEEVIDILKDIKSSL
ncbi:MAG: dynamin family protein [Peptostreptococcaceae bacterium]